MDGILDRMGWLDWTTEKSEAAGNGGFVLVLSIAKAS
jgi:hypothetical protein